MAARVGPVLAVCFGVAALWTGNPIHVALAAFIYLAGRAEENQVLHEDRSGAGGSQESGLPRPGTAGSVRATVSGNWRRSRSASATR